MTELDSIPNGLSSEEAAIRLARDGPNLLDESGRRSFWHTLRSVVGEPMFMLLLGAGAVYMMTGGMLEAVALLGFVCIIIGVTVLQERRTQRALDGLRDLSSPRALVVRDSQLVRIAGRDVVVGDLLMLVEGDRVPADGELLQAHELTIDESLLTGESTPVEKQPFDSKVPTSLGRAFAGTLVLSGQGWLSVTATAVATEFGKIGQTLSETEGGRSPLQEEISRLTRQLAWFALVLCSLVAALVFWRNGQVLSAILAGITLAMALLPQEFPVIMIVFLALGARRMAKAGVLTRHLQAIETLGQTTALCVDKTGTLTENRMEVAALVVGEDMLDVAHLDKTLPETFHSLVEYAVLASERTPIDPMERAFHRLASAYLANTEHLHPAWSLVQEYELSPALRAMSHGWQPEAGERRPVAAKGAPEAIIDLCHLDEARAKEVAAQAAALAGRGLRVLAVAKAEQHGDEWPALQHDFPFQYVGLIGLADPLRAEVPAAMESCRAAGVKVFMITGDHPTTARAIADQAGFGEASVLSGLEIDALDDRALAGKLESVRIFARVSPQQKLRLVQALRRGGEVVAMTGDGVNDAPALKAAHIGVAMGKRGTDVAREAASLILTNDNFAAIVEAIAHGRRIYENLMRAMIYTLAVHMPTIALTFVPIWLGMSPMLLPLHIAFIELVIDPACSVVFESEPGRRDAMSIPPRRADERMVSPRTWLLALGAGTMAAVAVLFAYWLDMQLSADEASVRTASFVAIVLVDLALIFGVRVPSRLTGVSIAVGLLTLVGLSIVCLVPVLQVAFGFAAISLPQLGVAGFAASLAYVSSLGAMRFMRRGQPR